MNRTESIYILAPSGVQGRFGLDRLMPLILRQAAVNQRLLEQSRIEKGQRVLDLGCGTGALAVLIKKAHSDAEVIGIDSDRATIENATANARKQGVNIPFFDAPANDLPCRDNYFDRIFASMIFPRLVTKDKIRVAEEMFRVLKPGGDLHVADFGKPQNRCMDLVAHITRKFGGMDDNIEGLLPHIVYAADFEHIETMKELMTVFGTISLLRAHKPRSKGAGGFQGVEA